MCLLHMAVFKGLLLDIHANLQQLWKCSPVEQKSKVVVAVVVSAAAVFGAF